MTETATTIRHDNTNPIMDHVVYWRVSAFALAAVALLGFIVNILFGNQQGLTGFLVFDYAHNILHVVLAAAAFTFGYAAIPANVSRSFALVFGVVYLGLGVLGFFVSDLVLLSLEIGENLVHLVLGAWGIMVGLAGRS